MIKPKLNEYGIFLMSANACLISCRLFVGLKTYTLYESIWKRFFGENMEKHDSRNFRAVTTAFCMFETTFCGNLAPVCRLQPVAVFCKSWKSLYLGGCQWTKQLSLQSLRQRVMYKMTWFCLSQASVDLSRKLKIALKLMLFMSYVKLRLVTSRLCRISDPTMEEL